ncbi:MAG TPA: adenylyl-sulfate reductase subunit beta [Thermoplasmata archaeon]|jgi:adenylylsulfate reductase, subunit B|nr:adenylyl-sulfate reductase subunit beta [Thermoplasmata archaeon]HTW77389.1 adenylyl-sulfate reductase subunit beta [Thermoplasmata archaeon]
MPTYVLRDKCLGCGQCVRICPSNIMHIDPREGRARNVEPEMCWECFACVKACPEGAIEVRGYADFAPLGARVVPNRTTDRIHWTVRMRGGEVKEFEYPIRKRPWGSIRSPAEEPAAPPDALGSPLLSFEPDYLAVDALPTLGGPWPTPL